MRLKLGTLRKILLKDAEETADLVLLPQSHRTDYRKQFSREIIMSPDMSEASGAFRRLRNKVVKSSRALD